MNILLEDVNDFGIPIEEDYKTAKVSFEKQKVDPKIIKLYLDDFKKLKDQKVKDHNQKNIDLWAKGSFEDFKIFVDSLKDKQTKTQLKKAEKSEGAELVAQNDDWLVYKITSHNACMSYGANTKWCITNKTGNEWNTYKLSNNFYFIISKVEREDNWNKIALQIDTDGNESYWDDTDQPFRSVPGNLDIPKFKIDIPEAMIRVDDRSMSISEFQSSKNIKVGGDLDLSGTKITSLPEGLEVGGDLDLSGTKITSLPEGLEVGRSLNLYGTKITSLPEGLKVGGDLNLPSTKITSLPEGLKVGGYLNLSGTKITSLPEGLEVGRSLNLSGTKITSLPEGLEVGGYLNLYGTKITSLPEGLKVDGDLNLSGTPLSKNWDDSMKPKGVFGKVFT